MSKYRLLVVDDEPDYRMVLKELFESEYEVHVVENGQQAVDAAPRIKPDLIILDIVMPQMDGLTAFKHLQEEASTQHIPVIFLTSKNEPEMEIRGLELGADDFIAKPFNRDVLKVRVKKRLEGGKEFLADITEMEGYKIIWERQEIQSPQNETIALTTKEMGLLRIFVTHPGRILSREAIMDRVWSDTYITDRTVDSHIKELRKKLPPLVDMLKTVYGAGYRLDFH